MTTKLESLHPLENFSEMELKGGKRKSKRNKGKKGKKSNHKKKRSKSKGRTRKGGTLLDLAVPAGFLALNQFLKRRSKSKSKSGKKTFKKR